MSMNRLDRFVGALCALPIWVTVGAGLALGLSPVSGCSNVEEQPPADLTVVLDHPFGRTFGEVAQATILLEGYDQTTPSQESTVIEIYQYSLTGLPATLELDLPEQPHELIEQGLVEVDPADARFYFTVYLDADNDEQICPGDYGQDWNLSAQTEYGVILPSQLTIFLEEKGDTFSCRPPIPR